MARKLHLEYGETRIGGRTVATGQFSRQCHLAIEEAAQTSAKTRATEFVTGTLPGQNSRL